MVPTINLERGQNNKLLTLILYVNNKLSTFYG